MNKSTNDDLQDLSDQVRSQIREFYLVNSAFLVANSFLASYLKENLDSLSNYVVVLFIFLLNSIWFFSIRLAFRWSQYWICIARSQNPQSIWGKDHHIKFTSFLSLKRLFFLLPFLFTTFITYFLLKDPVMAFFVLLFSSLFAVLGESFFYFQFPAKDTNKRWLVCFFKEMLRKERGEEKKEKIGRHEFLTVFFDKKRIKNIVVTSLLLIFSLIFLCKLDDFRACIEKILTCIEKY